MHYEIIFNILYIILSVWITFVNLKFIKNYFVKEKTAGKLVYVLKKSPSRMLLFCVISTWFIYDTVQTFWRNSVIQYSFEIMYIILEIEIILFLIMRFLLPQKIYENGILNLWNPPFIEWKTIKKIEKSNKKDDTIWIVLKEKKIWTERIQVYCLPGMAPTIVEYIQNKMKSL